MGVLGYHHGCRFFEIVRKAPLTLISAGWCRNYCFLLPIEGDIREHHS